MSPVAEPGWLASWRAAPLDATAALARFDALPGVPPERMTGRWRGVGLPSGHPLDGLLEALGWHGKEFLGADGAHPLLFREPGGGPGGEIVPLDPALMPARVALLWPALARSAPARRAFFALRPVLRARGPTARLQLAVFRGVSSAAMAYDRQPIVDHFRAIDQHRVLGLMEMRAARPPYFFLLSRDGSAG